MGLFKLSFHSFYVHINYINTNKLYNSGLSSHVTSVAPMYLTYIFKFAQWISLKIRENFLPIYNNIILQSLTLKKKN